MNETFIVLFMLITCVGILLYFIGWINTIFMALGNDNKILAIIIFILNPVAVFYCIKHWNDAKTQGKQLISGFIIICVTIIPAYYYYSNNIIS